MVKAINNEIVAKRVIFIYVENNMGEVDLEYAMDCASRVGLDLVQLNDGEIPTVKAMDYSKFLYHQKKNKKKQPKVEQKELKFRPNTDVNDINRLIKQAQGFLDKGNSVKFTVQFRGRETHFTNKVLDNFKYISEGIDLPKGFSVKHDVVVNNRRMTLIISK